MIGRRLLAPPTRGVLRAYVRTCSRGWADASRLFVLGDRGGWSVDEDARQLAAAAERLGLDVRPGGWARHAERQSVFHTSQFEAVLPHWLESSHRLGVAYLHGRPGTPGAPEFDRCFDALRRSPGRVERIQVTHQEMHDVVLSAGVDPISVHRIPIGIELEHFPFGDADARAVARAALGIPVDGFVVGSFQKDGVGWGEGLQPKLIKGPDTLVAVAEELKAHLPRLLVLLTGPARGYVMRELTRRAIAFRRVEARTRAELARAYHALDAYVVTSRQEGGPKGVLESMATGAPLVTTRVGQAPELVQHGVNGLLADVDDVEAIAGLVVRVGSDETLRDGLRVAGRRTAEEFAAERLDERWRALFDGFVAGPENRPTIPPRSGRAA